MNVEIGERRLEELLAYEEIARRFRKAGIRTGEDAAEFLREHAELKRLAERRECRGNCGECRRRCRT